MKKYAAEVLGRVRTKKCIRVVRELIALVYGTPSDNAGSRTFPNRQVAPIGRGDRTQLCTHAIGQMRCRVTSDAETDDQRIVGNAAITKQTLRIFH